MKYLRGFTLIEVLIFIIVSSLLMGVVFLGISSSLRSIPQTQQRWVALQAAKGCIEWFVEQRRLNGYASISCPSTLSTTSCVAPSGYSISANAACTTWNGDSNFKTISVSVTGLAAVSLSVQIGDY